MPRRVAAGSGYVIPGREGRRIVVTFDEDTFAQVRSIAVARNVPFSVVVRELVEFGLIDVGAEA